MSKNKEQKDRDNKVISDYLKLMPTEPCTVKAKRVVTSK